MELRRFYKKPLLSEAMERNLTETFNQQVCGGKKRILEIQTEICFYLEIQDGLSDSGMEVLRWLLSETFEPQNFGQDSFLDQNGVIEVGPRMNFETSWSTNALQEIRQCGVPTVARIEHSRRYLPVTSDQGMSDEERAAFTSMVHDRMTEEPYPEPLKTFETGLLPEPVAIIPLIGNGPDALKEAAAELGLAFDEFDIKHISHYFVEVLERNPTDVELFQYGQANSDHSRHHRFGGKQVIDGQEMPYSLMDLIKRPYSENPGKTWIAFHDNASVTEGYMVKTIVPQSPGKPSPLIVVEKEVGITFNAETHNFPSAVAAFPGAETGVGGRIRDDIGVGRGALIGGNTAAYMVGDLMIPGNIRPWEITVGEIPSNIMQPIDILIEASNGASDYANKFGIPLTGGAVRSFDMRVPGGERRAYLKCIMFTGGKGLIFKEHLTKHDPKKGMYVILLGGPSYRIGIGGSSASSMGLGENVEELDFSAVQRGDAEMERRVYNVIEACVKMGENSPILSVHDLGAGGVCNAIPEIVYPAGGLIDLGKIPIGDKTLSTRENWGNESQERMVILVDDEGLRIVKSISEREKCPFAVIGVITGDGKLVLKDERDCSTPVNMDMNFALGEIPQKTFHNTRPEIVTRPLELPDSFRFEEMLLQMLSHPDVCSKGYLTVKADRSVTGRVVRQQCCGPLHLPLADYSLIAHGFFDKTGTTSSIGQTPIYGLLGMGPMARMSLGEAITNIMFANGESLGDINLCVNVMWAAGLPGELANLYDVYSALTELQMKLGIRTDGGKDSSSMYAKARNLEGDMENVKIPGTLVISARMPCPDISNSKNVTPDIKMPGRSRIMHIDLARGKRRMGGSVFSRILNQLGEEPPDVDVPNDLKAGYDAVQEMLKEELILSGHDISDGGLATALCEMAIGGNCGLTANLETSPMGMFRDAFSEELGVVIEYLPQNYKRIVSVLENHGLGDCYNILGRTTKHYITFYWDMVPIFRKSTHSVRVVWEYISHMLDMRQANPECVKEAMFNTRKPSNPVYSLPENFSDSRPVIEFRNEPKLAVVYEEGTNAKDEMSAAFLSAGFEVHEIAMTDIIAGIASLRDFQMIAWPGGFSFADVLDAGKGWAGTILFNDRVRKEFDEFYARDNTMSFGVCNACQTMSLIGWVPWKGIPMEKQPRFIRNTSERFECRFPTVVIEPSPSVMLKGLEGASLGVWVRHGEGRFYCPDEEMLKEINGRFLAPVRFTEDGKNPTEKYPLNPNHSPLGITGLVTPDGRHLAMMPHPEALITPEVWPWMPAKWSGMDESPWMRIFHNARAFYR